MTTAVSASTTAAQELAMRVGSYIPRSAVMGLSYMSGSIGIDSERVALPVFSGVGLPLSRDTFTPSIPELFGGIDTDMAAVPSDALTDSGEPAEPEVDDADSNASVSGDKEERDSADESVDTASNGIGEEYTPEEQRVISELRNRDREVRAHEQAHVSVGGAYIRGGVSYEYEQGPDNRRYAVGGEVSIDSSPVRNNPEATVAKMQIVRAAALAPADPSAQDRAVASAAAREESRAAAELNNRRAASAYSDPYAEQALSAINLVA